MPPFRGPERDARNPLHHMTSVPSVDLSPGETLHGFRVRKVTPLESERMAVVDLEHERTGAQVLHLYCDDRENLLSVVFPPPPLDDTGVAHILEHAVLSGSHRFPVRDPFFEMVKMSMATFINAMTACDCTYYPVASNVRQDLFNLADVYMDAVFRPLLTEDTFMREGHHLAPADPDEPTGGLTISGIVYNEMKAAFSQPESRLYRITSSALFPDSVYGKESGGDPDAIPELTWEGLREFHARWYRPANAHFVLYGDIPTGDYLAFLDARFAGLESARVDPAIALQSRWGEPRTLEAGYAIGSDEEDKDKTFLEINWLDGDARNPVDRGLLHILSTVLLGDDASPLRKAIVDSHIGQDLIWSGQHEVGMESVFSVGVKGAEADRADAFQALVMGTLEGLAEGEIDPDLVDAAFQKMAYHREIKGMEPLKRMYQVIQGGWLYGGDPLEFLRADDLIAVCRKACDDDPRILNRMIRERLVDNPHRLDVVLRPDREWQARHNDAFQKEMKRLRSGKSDEAMRGICREAERLQRDAGTPNSPQALETLPQLKLGDLPRHPVHIPTSVDSLPGERPFLTNDVFANGVNYFQLHVSLEGLPEDLWPWLPRYLETFNKLGAAGQSYDRIARRRTRDTGALSAHYVLDTHLSGPDRTAWGVRYSLKALDEQVEPALSLFHDLLLLPEPGDRDRFRDVIVQTLASLRSELVDEGPDTAARHAARGLSREAWLDNLTHGLPEFHRIETLHDRFDALVDEMVGKIERIAGFLRNRARFTASFTGSPSRRETIRGAIAGWLQSMSDEPCADGVSTGFQPLSEGERTGLAAPIDVAHCAQVVPAVHLSHPDAPLLTLAMQLLRVDYMVSELRFRGNAYGASCRYDGRTIGLTTYADPHIHRTLGVFRALPDYVRKVDWAEAEIARGIISTCKHGLKPLRPGTSTALALGRHMTGDTVEVRERRFEKVLTATSREVKRVVLEALDGPLDTAPVCVVASREALEKANADTTRPQFEIAEIFRGAQGGEA